MEFVQVCDIGLGCGRSKITIGVNGEVGMVSFIGEERRYSSSSTRSVIIGEFRKG